MLDIFILTLEESKEIYTSLGEMAGFIHFRGTTTLISWILSASHSIYSTAPKIRLCFRTFVSSVDNILMIGFDHLLITTESRCAEVDLFQHVANLLKIEMYVGSLQIVHADCKIPSFFLSNN